MKASETQFQKAKLKKKNCFIKLATFSAFESNVPSIETNHDKITAKLPPLISQREPEYIKKVNSFQ